MNARRAIIGLCAICALLISAIAAQGASAAEETTAYTCSPSASKKDKGDADCISEGSSFGHTEIPVNTTTELSGSGGVTVLQTTIAGAAIKLTAQKVTPGTEEGKKNWMENKFVEEHMFAFGEGSLTYDEVATALPNCTVVGLGTNGGAGMIQTKRLKATTLNQKMGLKFEPASGTVFAEFEFTGGASCSVNGLKVTVTGSVVGTPNGSTVTFNHTATTNANTLKANGTKAGIEGNLTLEGRTKETTGAFTPLSVTT